MIVRQLDHNPASVIARVMPSPVAPIPETVDVPARAHPLHRLQRTVGNRRVQHMLALHQRPAEGGADGRVSASMQRTIETARAGGRPLGPDAAAELQQALGAAARRVRVHTDQQADRLSRALHASAFTVGSDIFFRASHYRPGTGQGKRLLAHELAHVVQQHASVRAAPRLRLATADDPGERAADRIAGDAVAGRAAPTAAVTAQAPLIQRKAFIGDDTDPRSRWVQRAEFGVRQNNNPYMVRPTIGYKEAEMGTGDRNVDKMVTDQKSRYFRDLNEFFDYAQNETEDIGYVDREKTWVRLPGKFLVLGERHNGTTLPDLVRATGTTRYIYEGGSYERPSPYLQPSASMAEGAGAHALEEILPKLVVGLVGVENRLRRKLAALSRSPGWKARILSMAEKAKLANPREAEEKYERKLAEWSFTWEQEHQTPASRASVYIAQPGAGRYKDELLPGPPDSPYSRKAAEVRLTRKALEELRSATFGDDERITEFYLKNQPVIDETIYQLKSGLPVHLSRMFLKMATGKFDLRGLIRLLQSASEQEFTALRVEDLSLSDQNYRRSYETAQAGHRMEALRDSYMLHKILAAKAAGDRLAGLGDKHRQNLEKVLKQRDPDILVEPWTEFYKDQYRLHPDRD